MFAALVLIASAADAQQKRGKQLIVGPLSKEACEKLRAVFAEWDRYGEALVNQGAIDRGVTWAQIKQARAGCK